MKPRIEVIQKLYVCRLPGTLNGYGFDYCQAWHQWLILNRKTASGHGTSGHGMGAAAHGEHACHFVKAGGDVLQNNFAAERLFGTAADHDYLQ